MLFRSPLMFGTFLRLARWLLPRADGLRVVNELERRVYLRLGVPASRIRVIPVPAQTERFLAEVAQDEVSGLKQTLGIEPGEPVLLWVGRPVACKRLPLLFETFARVRREVQGARLVVVGQLTFDAAVLALLVPAEPPVGDRLRADELEAAQNGVLLRHLDLLAQDLNLHQPLVGAEEFRHCRHARTSNSHGAFVQARTEGRCRQRHRDGGMRKNNRPLAATDYAARAMRRYSSSACAGNKTQSV